MINREVYTFFFPGMFKYFPNMQIPTFYYVGKLVFTSHSKKMVVGLWPSKEIQQAYFMGLSPNIKEVKCVCTWITMMWFADEWGLRKWGYRICAVLPYWRRQHVIHVFARKYKFVYCNEMTMYTKKNPRIIKYKFPYCN